MDKIEEIKRLASLLKEGAITQKEFETLKKNVLNSIDQPTPPKKDRTRKKIVQDSETTEEEEPFKSKRGNTKKKITQKEAFNMLDRMDVAVVEQNIIWYAQVGDFNKVELLLIAGINPNVCWYNEEEGRNVFALHNTAGYGKPEMVKLLLDNGAEVNLIDDLGYTALFYAIDTGKIEPVKLLIENGADIHHMGNNKINPLQYARKQHKHEIVELLTSAGAGEIVDKEPKISSRKKKKDIIPDKPYLKNYTTNKNDLIASFIMYATIALIVVISIISGVQSKSSVSVFIVLAFFIPAYFITYRIFKRNYSKLRSTIVLTIIPIIVIICLMFPSESSQQTPSSSSSASPSSDSKYCSKHNRMYNPNNAWGGCPQCVEEEDQKKYKNAIEKSKRL